MTMRRQTLLIRYEPQATPPAGDPPSFDVTSGPGTVTLLEGDDTGVPTEASYQTHVTMTGETTFLEDGELAVDGGSLRLETVGSGTIEPSAEEGTLRGSVIWKVEGTGRLTARRGCSRPTSSSSPTPEPPSNSRSFGCSCPDPLSPPLHLQVPESGCAASTPSCDEPTKSAQASSAGSTRRSTTPSRSWRSV